VFDVGETLVDETRIWGLWADWLRVPRLTFFAILGGCIERGETPSQVLERVRPGLDLRNDPEGREVARGFMRIEAGDLYPDAVPCLQSLRDAGYLVAIAGNQPAGTAQVLADLGVPADVIATSEGWGVSKPSPEFFDRVVAEVGVPAPEIAYVGDRVDNDVLPSLHAGMVAVFLRRGPWGYLHASLPDVERAQLRIDSLDELPARLEALR
jgi:FMN phosphatase YigB (HAD superfamily)